MIQVYIPYWEWEDWKNGMWRKLSANEELSMINVAILFTGDHIKYGSAMSEVINLWPRTMLNSMTNTSINRRAFLGHCACQYKINCPEYITREAWHRLNDKQRFLADKIAQETINKWVEDYENQNRTIRQDVGKQMLLKWDTG
jgi:hypothetical protein